MEYLQQFLALFHRRPRLNAKLSGTMVVTQGLCAILSFVVNLYLLVTPLPWYSWVDENGDVQQLAKEAVPVTTRLIIASVALSTLSLILIVVPTRTTEQSWIITKTVSFLALGSFACLLSCLIFLRNQTPESTELTLDLPFHYLIGTLALNVTSCALFPFLLFFGQDPQFSANGKNLLIALVFITFFLFYGGLIFWSLEGWDYEFAVMFCLVTITSIGYGNNFPTMVSTKLIVIFFAILGLAFIGFAIEQFRRLLVEDVAAQVATRLKKMKNKVIQDGPPKEDEERKISPLAALWGKRSGAFLSLVSWWLIGSAIFMKLENWEYLDSFYFSLVTLSTIGYGDMYPKTSSGIIFLIFYSLGGLGLFAFGLSTIGDSTGGLDNQIDNIWGIVAKTEGMGARGLSTLMSSGSKVGGFMKEVVGKNTEDLGVLQLVKATSVAGTTFVFGQPYLPDPAEKEQDNKDNETPAPPTSPTVEVAAPKDRFVIHDKENFDKYSAAAAKALQKLLTCESSAVDAWLREYRKKRDLFEETFRVESDEQREDREKREREEEQEKENKKKKKSKDKDKSKDKSRSKSQDGTEEPASKSSDAEPVLLSEPTPERHGRRKSSTGERRKKSRSAEPGDSEQPTAETQVPSAIAEAEEH